MQFIIPVNGNAFGFPKTFFSDNGKEFQNKLVQGYLSKFGGQINCTAPYSPHSNGTCERHHTTIDKLFTKIREDPEFKETSDQELLNQVCFYHNCETNKHGFSALQVIHGGNPPLYNSSDHSITESNFESDAEAIRHIMGNQNKIRNLPWSKTDIDYLIRAN